MFWDSYIEKDFIKKKIWDKGRAEIWKETICNSRVPTSTSHLRSPKPYMALPRYQSRIYFAYRIGELQFKDYRRGEFKKRFGNTKCFADGCSEPDRLEHAMVCDGYPKELRFTRPNFNHDRTDDQKQFIEYLVKLDGYRAKYFYLPVLYRPSTRQILERQLGLR